jgi:hypothetical protein
MKIAVCVPCSGEIKGKTTACLADLSAAATAAGQTIKTFVAEVGPLEFKRAQLVRRGREWGADWLLFVDSDQTFAPDALNRLLRHQKPVVGANYLSRHDPAEPTALDGNNKRIWPARGLQEVAALGLGFCLVHSQVFDRLGDVAPFVSTIDSGGGLVCGEDVHFFNLVRAAGIPVFLDHDLNVGHIAEVVRTFSREGANAGSVLSQAGAQ